MSHSLDFAFRLVHIHNIPHILKDGFVCGYSSKASKDYISIGDGEVIAKRCATQVNDGILLSRYVPFYLGPRSPMLYVIQNGFNGVKRFSPSELVYCIVRLSDIQQEPNIDCVFTDGHALSSITRYYPKEYLYKIHEFVKREDVYARYWISEDDLDLKRRKEAELLVKDELSASFICGYVVYNDESRERLVEYGIDASKIVVKESFYF